MKQAIYATFCALGLIGSIDASIIAKNHAESISTCDTILTNLNSISNGLFNERMQEIDCRCRKCGKPK